MRISQQRQQVVGSDSRPPSTRHARKRARETEEGVSGGPRVHYLINLSVVA